jgi:ferredoxin--NADP+ reductase
VAVVGSGPAGFYAAEALLASEDPLVHVDVFERLPTPWGLVRSGVAPDHPKLKNVSKRYAGTAEHERFRFFGNVTVGEHVTREELLERYDAVVYAFGAQTDRALGIPGEDLPGSASATAFVGWYNGHPDFRDEHFDLSAERAVVIGNGNVAVDVARMLSLAPAELERTDIADHALDALRDSRVREVLMVGRRGPVEAAFTHPELRELGEMGEADLIVEPDEVASCELPDDARPAVKRNVQWLIEHSDRERRGHERRIVLRFLRSPVELRGNGRVEQVVLARNELRAGDDGRMQAHDTGEREVVDAGLVLRAVGYRGVSLPGVPFDDRRNVIPSDAGCVTGGEREYVVGWIKRGPTGIIGTNKKDAQETVSTLLEHAAAGRLNGERAGSREEREAWLAERQPDLVTQEGWLAIDRHERELGEPHQRPRVKLTRIEELVRAGRGR